MRTLILMRHAKSDWSKPGCTDHDRPLNARGRRASVAMARHLSEQAIQADVILASSAVRVQETIQLMRDSWGDAAELLTQRGLYLASAAEIGTEIHGLHDSWEAAMVVGHNPGMTAFVSWLSRQDLEMPTAAVAVFKSDADTWLDSLKTAKWQLHAYWKPRDLV